jgi:hypothetical protein
MRIPLKNPDRLCRYSAARNGAIEVGVCGAQFQDGLPKSNRVRGVIDVECIRSNPHPPARVFLRPERDCAGARTAFLTTQPIAHIGQRISISQMGA